jgi:CRISPR-associated protein Cmr1
MQTKRYELSFLAPAFMGDASQAGAWRTPPFKALLREWWRIRAASRVNYDIDKLRALENGLFGTAADSAGGDSRVSQLRMSLASWRPGALATWPPPQGGARLDVGSGRSLPADFYLGYGPLVVGGKLKAKRAIKDGEANELNLAWPDSSHFDLGLDVVLPLVDAFGTLGGRCRNGWGSLAVKEKGSQDFPCISADLLKEWRVLRPLKDCLREDWPHAIGSDVDGPLVWESIDPPFKTWRDALGVFATARLSMRRTARSMKSASFNKTQPLDAIVQPTTGRPGFGGSARIANTLRFKLFRDEAGALRTRIYHTPCRPPRQHDMQGVPLLETWQAIHAELDRNPKLERLP